MDPLKQRLDPVGTQVVHLLRQLLDAVVEHLEAREFAEVGLEAREAEADQEVAHQQPAEEQAGEDVELGLVHVQGVSRSRRKQGHSGECRWGGV